MSRISPFVPLAFLMLVIAVTGFWNGYFRGLLTGTLDARALLHLHAAVSVGWIVLVGIQAYLAASGRRALHVAVGRWGLPFGVVVIVVGLWLALTLFAERAVREGPAAVERSLTAPLTDMAVFSIFLAGGWIARRRPEAHKRFILLATNTLLIAAIARDSGGTRSVALEDVLPFLLVWLSPLLVAMGYDLCRQRRVHPVYIFGLVLLVALRYRQLLRESDAWPYVTRWLVERLT